MWRSPGIGILVLAVTLVACVTGKGGSGGSGGPPAEGVSACERSVEADVETARGRLRDGRPDRALLYVQALAPCPEAVAFAPFLELALDVYEETGRLNEAWNIARLQHDRAVDAGDEAAARQVSERMQRFRTLYVLVEVAQDGRRPPLIRYAGPMQDDATSRQLAAMESERGVWMEGGVVGYWLYPGRYRVDGDERTLEAGEVLGSGASR